MATVQQLQPATASNSEGASNNGAQLALRRFAQASLKPLADALDLDESQICRIRSEEARVTFSQSLSLIRALGCKVVDADAVCVSREKYQAIATIAAAAMADQEISHRLIWEE